jgi:hypothetical protein
MAYAIGIVLGILVGLFLRTTGFDRDRAVYPTILIVIPGYYVLFAAMAGSTSAIIIESLMLIGFAVVAVWGFAKNLWWIAAALAGHGLWDLIHGGLISNPGVPEWWPAFCSSIDIVLGAWLGVLLRQGRIPAGGRHHT